MYKRILRGISAILVLIMLAEMLPTTLLGNFVQRVAAAEVLDPTTAYTVDAPFETSDSREVEVPPTLIEDTDIIVSPEEINNGTTEINSVQSVSESNSPDLSAPYFYQYNQRETVSLQSGVLDYKEIDYVLPGINGLDLEIGRVYSSAECHKSTSDTSNDYKKLLCPGVGWRFTFSRIEGTRLYLSDGRTFRIADSMYNRDNLICDYRLK